MPRQETGFYIAAGRTYPDSDLFGYPDSLIRARVGAAYKNACLQIGQDSFRSGRVLDIGSCHGHGVATIKQMLSPSVVVSTDRWVDFLLSQKRGLRQDEYLNPYRFVALDANKLPFADSTMQATFCMHVIEHIRKPEELLQEMKRVTTHDGFLVIATPNVKNLVANNLSDEHVFNSSELSELLTSEGLDSAMYYLIPNNHAWNVHRRKKWIAGRFPQTGELRKMLPWKIVDRMVLWGNLKASDFSLSQQDDDRAIDLVVIAKKK